ncbi:interleukin-1 receptor type 2-like isoform X3 [Mobula birostris]|uniref:interleukin-1 receptor type 2-like isoform X3 n=1 Tax=Mobula birostris TaxID=1983395 RepID=UPI003B27DC73
MIVLLAVFVSLCISVSSSNVCETAAQNKSTKGSKLEVTCTVLAELHPAEILVYWLANQTFIEEYSRDNRIKETESERKGTEKSYLDATLNFSKVERKDFAVTFVCVILSGETDLARYISIKPAVSNVHSHIAIAVAVLISIIMISICMYKLLKHKPPQTYVNIN